MTERIFDDTQALIQFAYQLHTEESPAAVTASRDDDRPNRMIYRTEHTWTIADQSFSELRVDARPHGLIRIEARDPSNGNAVVMAITKQQISRTVDDPAICAACRDDDRCMEHMV